MRRLRSERGQAAVEFALVIPVMLLFMLGIFEVGRTYFNNEAIATAARDGARAGAIHTGSTAAQVQGFVQAAIYANAPGLKQSSLTIVTKCIDPADSSDTDCYKQNMIVDVTVTYPYHIGVLSFAASGTLKTHTQLRFE
jgi:Flp pilus assembly protein TadG